jgi:hypothetical protein
MPSNENKPFRAHPKKDEGSGAWTVFKSCAIGSLIPLVLGIVYGLLFLTSWNVWPAFIIAGMAVGGIAGLAIGVVIVFIKWQLRRAATDTQGKDQTLPEPPTGAT